MFFEVVDDVFEDAELKAGAVSTATVVVGFTTTVSVLTGAVAGGARDLVEASTTAGSVLG